MTYADLLNHLVSTLIKDLHPWRFANADREHATFDIEFIGTGDIVQVSWDGQWCCEDIRGDKASRLWSLLNGYVRNDAGESVAPAIAR